METFQVTVIKKGSESEYQASAAKAMESIDVWDYMQLNWPCFIEVVEADSYGEANELARQKYPNNEIDEEATYRM